MSNADFKELQAGATKPERKLHIWKYVKIMIPAIIVVVIGVFFLIKPSKSTYIALVKFNENWGFIDKI